MNSPRLSKTLAVVATIVVGWIGSIPTILGLPLSKETTYFLVVLSGVLVLILAFVEVRDYIEGRPASFKREQDTYPYMCSVVDSPSPVIFGVSMSYTSRKDVQDALRERARQGDLTICLPRMIKFAKELQNLGATVHEYGDAEFTPKSRFTIVRHQRGDAELFYGHKVNGAFVIEHFKASDQDPAYSLAQDIIDIVKRFAPPRKEDHP